MQGRDGYDLAQQAAWCDATLEVLRQQLGSSLQGIVTYCRQANLGDTSSNYTPVTTPEVLVIGYSWNLHEKPALPSRGPHAIGRTAQAGTRLHPR